MPTIILLTQTFNLLRSRSSTAGLKLKPIERRRATTRDQNFEKLRQGIKKMRIASIFVNLVEESEDDVEILDVSQYVKENLNVPFDDYNLYDETDEDSGADEGLGSEIIYPKNIQTKEEEAQQFLTEVEKVLKVVSSL